MTREEAIKILNSIEHGFFINDRGCEAIEMGIEALEQEPETRKFAKWVATEIFDDMWKYNKDAFAEIACRKLAKLDIVRANGDEWELVEPQESEDKECVVVNVDH